MYLATVLTTFFLLLAQTIATPIPLPGNPSFLSSLSSPSAIPTSPLSVPQSSALPTIPRTSSSYISKDTIPLPASQNATSTPNYDNSIPLPFPASNITTFHTITVTTPSSPQPLCTQNERFTLGYQVCTFASIIDETLTAEMWLFDADCAVLGSARGVSVPYTGLGGGSKVVPYNFDSSLDYVTVTDLGNGSESVDIWYMGKQWGGNDADCWMGGGADTGGETWYGCSFEFDC